MTNFVQLYWKKNRGWPWPEDSWGLSPMFGPEGWCHSCGVPRHEQNGSLALERKGLKVEGAWTPYWRFDAICLEQSLADEVAGKFRVSMLPVRWHGTAPGEASQIVVPSVGEAWFDSDGLREKAIERHGTAGATCPECGVWRWMPLTFGMLPPLKVELSDDVDIAASPEWFGDGWKAFRQILVRRELAELIAKASPRDFKVQKVR
jgi:hypothetical protein